MDDYKKITIENYDKVADEFAQRVESLHNKSQSDVFIGLIPKGCSILDLGCGSGRDAKIFADSGYKVTGVDLSTKMIDNCQKRKINANFHVMDITSLKFEDETYDAIWANASFIHLSKKEIKKGLDEANRVLKRSGIVYISVKEGKTEGIEKDRRYSKLKKFVSYYSKEEIEKYLLDSGFAIIRSDIEIKDDNYANHPWINVFCRK